MARIINDDLIFIHVAKTGGTFFKEIINYNGIRNYETGEEINHKHIGYTELIEDYPNHTYFAFIRKPHEWLISRYAYACKTDFGDKIKVLKSAQSHWMADVWDNSLNGFIKNVIKKCPDIPTTYFNDMTLMDESSNVKIFTMERMDIAFDWLSLNLDKKIAVPKTLKNYNKSTKYNIDDSYVNSIYEANIKIYNKYY